MFYIIITYIIIYKILEFKKEVGIIIKGRKPLQMAIIHQPALASVNFNTYYHMHGLINHYLAYLQDLITMYFVLQLKANTPAKVGTKPCSWIC